MTTRLYALEGGTLCRECLEEPHTLAAVTRRGSTAERTEKGACDRCGATLGIPGTLYDEDARARGVVRFCGQEISREAYDRIRKGG